MSQKLQELENLKKKNKTYNIVIVTSLIIAIIPILITAIFNVYGQIYGKVCIAIWIILIAVIIKTIGSKIKSKSEMSIIEYLEGLKRFEFTSYTITKEVFNKELESGILPSYIIVNGKYHYIECQVSNDGKGIGDCYIDYAGPISLNEFLNTLIDGVSINQMMQIEFASVNNLNPNDYFSGNII